MTSCISSFLVNSLSISDFLLFRSHFFGVDKSCPAFAWVDDCLVAHVWLVNSIVGVCPINLPEDMLAHLVESDFVSALLLTNHCCKLFVHSNISVHKLSSEVIL